MLGGSGGAIRLLKPMAGISNPVRYVPAPAAFGLSGQQEWEHYSYANGDLKEMTSIPTSDQEKNFLLQTAMKLQLNPALPTPYLQAQATAISQYCQYVNGVDFPHVSTAFA